jgi:hypothetical protein
MESGEQLPRSDPRGGRGGWRAALFIIGNLVEHSTFGRLKRL